MPSLLVLMGVVSVTIFTLVQGPTSYPQTTSESVPILTEPIVTNVETPTIFSTYASRAVPTIDGVLLPDEWAQPAFSKTLSYVLKGKAKTGEMLGYITNDDNFLYIAIQVTAEGFEESTINKEGVFLSPTIWFDGDNDGVISVGEDVRRFWKSSYYDCHLGLEGSETSDTEQDGRGACSFSNGSYTYEYLISLNDGDPQDLAVHPGQTIGIKIVLTERENISSSHTTTIGTSGWPTGTGRLDASTYAKLILATENSTAEEKGLTLSMPPSSDAGPQFTNEWSDDFSDVSSGWPEETPEVIGKGIIYEAGYKSSCYEVVFKELKYGTSLINEKLGKYSDFSMAVDGWLEPADSHGSSGYGLVFRYTQDPYQYYEFAVYADGRYHIGKYTGGQYTLLVDYVTSPYIKKGEKNRLMVKCHGVQIDAYINGNLVASIEDDSLREGSVGLLARNEDASNVSVFFDNFYLAW